MARREGRRRRERERDPLALSSDSSSDSDNPGNGGNGQANPPNQQLARWTEERVFLLLETIESAPNRLYQENPNWGSQVPYSRRGAQRVPKNCLENMEYGDINRVLARARSDLNTNPAYLALSLQLQASESVVRDRYNMELATARRLRSAAPDKEAFDRDESHSRVLKLAIKINKQMQSGEERRAGNNLLR
jgi:hypothetical protein